MTLTFLKTTFIYFRYFIESPCHSFISTGLKSLSRLLRLKTTEGGTGVELFGKASIDDSLFFLASLGSAFLSLPSFLSIGFGLPVAGFDF
jgi:hypothetical protein